MAAFDSVFLSSAALKDIESFPFVFLTIISLLFLLSFLQHTTRAVSVWHHSTAHTLYSKFNFENNLKNYVMCAHGPDCVLSHHLQSQCDTASPIYLILVYQLHKSLVMHAYCVDGVAIYNILLHFSFYHIIKLYYKSYKEIKL